MKEIKCNFQKKYAAAHWCWQGGVVGREAKLSLWTELSHFSSWQRKYVIEKISDVVKETWAKNVKDFKSNLQKKHNAAHRCWQGGGVVWEAKLSLWAEFLPFPCWDHNNLSEKHCNIAMKNL
jgi:hypothetical protein